MSLVAEIQKDLDLGAVRLIAECRDRLYAKAIRLCKNPADADDLVSQTFAHAIQKLDTYTEDANLFGWLCVIMANLHKNWNRRAIDKATEPTDPQKLEECAGACDSTMEEVLRNSDREALYAAFNELDPKLRQTMSMYYLSELTLKEIACFFNSSTSAVSRQLQIGKKILAAKLGAKLGKKPVVLVLAALLGVCTLFGAWQGGVFDSLFKGETPKPLTAVAPANETTFQLNQPTNEGTSEMKIGSALKSVTAAALALAALASGGVTVDITKVQQRYPWNGLVDIDYKITRTGDEPALEPAKHSVEISVVNCDVTPVVTNVAHVFRQGALPVSDGAHRVTWDANAEGVNFKSQNVKVFAEVVHYAEKYMVIDVSGGPTATVYPVTYLHGAPEGGFNTTEYKGNKIVLRLIPPGSYVMGSPTTEPGRTTDTAAREVQHAVAITKPFYLGVFEITQKQYLNVMGSNPSQNTGDDRPVESVSYNAIRGVENTETHLYDWPHNQDVDMQNSFVGKLRSKCKEWNGETYAKDVDGLFDLPTDAQWEYACRAGTTTPFNNGVVCENDSALETQLNDLGRYTKNGGSTTQHAVVGTYAANAWGLYDMHGNVWELCRDWFQANVQDLANPSVDPVGASAGTARVARGGSWYYAVWGCRSAYRNSYAPSNVSFNVGFRLSRTLP